MKSQRRHELQHNALADWLVKSIEIFKPYRNILTTAVVLLLVALLAYTWFSRQSAGRNAQAWEELNTMINSNDLSRLANVIEQNPDTDVAHTAAIVLADFRLAEGCDRLFSNKAVAQQELGKAIDLYYLVRNESSSRMLLERATFGLARAKEAKGELATASELYKEITDRWPHGTYAATASNRIANLKLPATKEFYDQFAKFDPKPAFSSQPGDRPSFDPDTFTEPPAPVDAKPSVSATMEPATEADKEPHAPAEK